ncbi:MAG: STAS domain-containing protein [Anaeromyxobacter sp.]
MAKSKKRAAEKLESENSLVLSGDVTVSVLGDLQKRALLAFEAGGALHVDCRTLSYLDAAGHQFLCALRREGAARGAVVRITPPNDLVLADSGRLGMGGVFLEATARTNGESV